MTPDEARKLRIRDIVRFVHSDGFISEYEYVVVKNPTDNSSCIAVATYCSADYLYPEEMENTGKRLGLFRYWYRKYISNRWLYQ